jgi:PTS system mannose-specific IIA component
MKGLVIATHADMGAALLRACELIIGPLPNARAISVQREDDVEVVRQSFAEAIAAVGRDGDGVLIMTDMLGGTPANIGASFIDAEGVDLLTGVSLPMVLKFFNSKSDLGLTELALILKAYGQQGIQLASELLKR